MPTLPSDSSPAGLIGRTVKVYSSLQSYQDEGSVVVGPDEEGQLDKLTFQTIFKRPDHFKFNWVTSHPYPPLAQMKFENAISFNGVEALSWSNYGENPNQICKAVSFASAIASSTGISFGASYTISNLLFQDVFGVPFRDISACKVVGVESLDGISCYQIAGESRMGEQRIWIGTEDSLVRKIRVTVLGRIQEESRRNVSIHGSPRIEEFSLP